MNRPDQPSRREGPSPHCDYPWCTTEHGRTVHPDDEDHRSIGVAVPLLIRDGARADAELWTTVEIGLHRRLSDDQSWVTVDDGHDLRYEVALSSVHAALRALAADAAALREIRPDE